MLCCNLGLQQDNCPLVIDALVALDMLCVCESLVSRRRSIEEDEGGVAGRSFSFSVSLKSSCLPQDIFLTQEYLTCEVG